jgi:receptor expression-enhancing protein 5/6
MSAHCAGGSRQAEFALAQTIIAFYAGIKSFQAIQSSDPKDDKQWLTFWLLYSLFDLACTLSDFFLGMIVPFYNELKVAFLVFLGVFGGAAQVYPLVEPLLLQGEEVANKYKQRLADLGK